MTDKANTEESKPESKGVVLFVKEVAQYFMDFLETDFHKVRNPKRSIQNRNKNNLQICVNLNKYKKFCSLAWKTIRNGFEDDAIKEIGRGIYTNPIPKSLLLLIEEQIAAISPKEIESVISLFKNEINLGYHKYPQDSTAAITFAVDGIARVIKENFLAPFIQRINEPLDKMSVATVDSIYQIEEEVTEVLILPFEDVVSSIINNLSLQKPIDADSRLKEIFELQDIKSKLESYFKGFAAGDLFFEVSELVNNKSLLEKQEFYFYFCDLTYKHSTYPLFYIPVSVEKKEGGFLFSFDSLLYVNKKAIQFITQDHNSEIERKGSLKAFSERIIYLAEERTHLIGIIDQALKEIVNYFGLSPFIDTQNPERQISKGQGLQVSNSCYFGLFDKSDESLVNDYEEILLRLKNGDDELASAFQKLVDDFVATNPISVVAEVENEWDELSTEDKLVYSSPVPLNAEQRQVLGALNKSACKYITVEGPPGTGKSHTITAIACDAILKNQSILVLSDKKEALDVVEDKITETMNKVRLDKQFQNPILRLGQTGNTYTKILAPVSMERIKEHYKAVRSDYGRLEKNILNSLANLKGKIQNSVSAFEKIELFKVAELLKLEKKFSEYEGLPFNIGELEEDRLSDASLAILRENMFNLHNWLYSEQYNLAKLFQNFFQSDQSIGAFRNFLIFIEIVNGLRERTTEGSAFLSNLKEVSVEGIVALEDYVIQCKQLKSPWFGYLFKSKKVASLNQSLAEKLPHTFDRPHAQLSKLTEIVFVFKQADQMRRAKVLSAAFEFKADFADSIHQLISLNIELPSVVECQAILETLSEIENTLIKYKESSQIIGVEKNNIFSYCDNKLTEFESEDFGSLIEYLRLKNETQDHFNQLPEYDYFGEKASMEELVATQMTFKMDERVVNFYENNINDAKALKGVISKKQRFDKKSFEQLKNSFPCILSGIRDFAEFIPLESEIFDLVIIDEASQVSIAQAFPALLRGKKIIVLGDKKQFSNVKSAQARSDTNQEYVNRLREVFLNEISEEAIKVERLNKFNIKTSILEFIEHIQNFHVMLKKHFRGYKELISYSSKFFYDDGLQAIKIRAKPIEKVLGFTFIEHDGRVELVENTNQMEIEAIIKAIEKISEEESGTSIGIITPHTNQQKLLVDAFSRHKNYEHFCKQHRLKIMTFDTCQGEERDVVLYSMVANPVSDKLWGVFIKDRKSVDLEVEGKIKLQRLNVGFSRAKEQMHFFLSKSLDAYSGSISEALLHFDKVLEEAKKLPDSSNVDLNSPMETKVLHWIKETSFFKKNHSSIEVFAQFPLGEYIKQLDRRYKHAPYVVDFLLLYTDDQEVQHKIIIEYDGFEFHFQDHGSINEFNYDQYYTSQHVYREKVLESYGYNFVRINRFNVGKEPIEMLNNRLETIVKKKSLVLH